MNLSYIIFSLLPVLALMSLGRHRVYLLMALLSLEVLILGLASMLIFITPTSAEPHLILTLFSMAACEAALGLTLLVTLTRTRGTDNVKSLCSNKF